MKLQVVMPLLQPLSVAPLVDHDATIALADSPPQESFELAKRLGGLCTSTERTQEGKT